MNKPSGSARITLYLMVKADNLFSDFKAIVLGNIRTILRLIGTGSLVQIQMIKNIMIPLTLKHGSEIQKYVNILILLTITRIFVIILTTGNKGISYPRVTQPFPQNLPVSCVGYCKHVWWYFMALLAFIQFDNFFSIDWKSMIRINDNTKQARIGLSKKIFLYHGIRLCGGQRCILV